MSIEKIWAREILDSRGNPTVEVDLYTAKGSGQGMGLPTALRLGFPWLGRGSCLDSQWGWDAGPGSPAWTVGVGYFLSSGAQIGSSLCSILCMGYILPAQACVCTCVRVCICVLPA